MERYSSAAHSGSNSFDPGFWNFSVLVSHRDLGHNHRLVHNERLSSQASRSEPLRARCIDCSRLRRTPQTTNEQIRSNKLFSISQRSIRSRYRPHG